MLLGITGYNGILAKSLVKTLRKKNRKKLKFLYYKNDVTNFKIFCKWLEKIDILLHLAAVTPINKVNQDKKYAKKVNFESVAKALEIFKKNKNKKIIFISSSHVYLSSNYKLSETSKLKPFSYYGYLKYLSEKEIIKSTNNYLIIRLFSYYAKSQSNEFLIPSLINKIRKLEKNKLKLKNYDSVRDISSINFVVQNLTELILSDSRGVFNCGSGRGYSLEDLAIYIAKNKFNKEIEIDKRYKYKKRTKFISNNTKIRKITGIEDTDNLLKYL